MWRVGNSSYKVRIGTNSYYKVRIGTNSSHMIIIGTNSSHMRRIRRKIVLCESVGIIRLSVLHTCKEPVPNLQTGEESQIVCIYRLWFACEELELNSKCSSFGGGVLYRCEEYA